MQNKSYEYISTVCVLDRLRVRAQFRYPVGGAFGEFYAELAKRCIAWLENEYATYSGRGITLRFSAEALRDQSGITSVLLCVSLYEKGDGKLEERRFAQNWLDDGRLLPISRFLDKKTQKTLSLNGAGCCVLGGEIVILEKNGEKNPIGVKIGNLSQEILSQNLQNTR